MFKVDKKILVLFACCFPIKGFCRSIIYDIQRNVYFFIPNSLLIVLNDYRNKTIGEIKQHFSIEEQKILEHYITFLLENEVAFLCDKSDITLFPAMMKRWISPFDIENFVLDIDKDSKHDYTKIINELSVLETRVIHIRFFSNVTYSKLNLLLKLVNNSNIRSSEFILPFCKDIKWDNWVSTIKMFRKIKCLTFFGSLQNSILKIDQCTVIFTSKRISSERDCGIISKDIFSCNKELFMEAQNFNTCLNRKISIDKRGNIKNCPSMQRSFGQFGKKSLQEILQSKHFQSFWKLKKDDIHVCRDCEFRYMCSDCRAFIKDFSDIYSKPAKCYYNPYVAKWEGEAGYIAVEDSMQIRAFK